MVMAAILSALVVFAAGFALGAFRVMVTEPALGALAATLVELPVILAFAWVAVARVMRLRRVPRAPAQRIAMGVIALAVLLGLETLLGTIGFGRTLAQHFSFYAQPAAQLGLAGQVLFAAFPLIQTCTGR